MLINNALIIRTKFYVPHLFLEVKKYTVPYSSIMLFDDDDDFACSKSKMVIELLEGIHFVASLEAMSLGTQAGIHPWIIYDIISNAAGNSW